MYKTRKNNGITYIIELPKNQKIYRICPASNPLAKITKNCFDQTDRGQNP